ncbi:tyrosine-type recombinase/integrase [Paraburkholderia sp. UCT2]|uniref:tyrosine-type recombinase/integrase n=1 Tax=Paraburkholderia sp. UCT2 TaxID=2615208 RepID=UPI00165535F3|nr:tyrosine-type recombinase/integrase [Paraburkholderia sp. UCT2]MBC8732302.1 tyrosine-type recombinase/integrase [Paraburkholderia sp. UCT2]
MTDGTIDAAASRGGTAAHGAADGAPDGDYSVWIDTAVMPPQRLPRETDAALAWVAQVLGHPVYTRWTLTDLKRGAASLADARRDHPAIFALLLEHDAAVEYWARGRLHVVAGDVAPPPDPVLGRVLRQHRRFRMDTPDTGSPVAAGDGSGAVSMAGVNAQGTVTPPPGPWLTVLARDPSPPDHRTWLARAGRFVNPSTLTNTLGVTDDARAVALFLQERAGHSPHTLRAYVTELRRLMTWCVHAQRGPLSDLTRADLQAWRRSLDAACAPLDPEPAAARPDRPLNRPPSPASRSRALAVISSLYHFWQKTGYLIANPAAGLSGGAAARRAWTPAPARMLPAAALALCDAVMAGAAPDGLALLPWRRRGAVWALYRYAGVRLAELVLAEAEGLPRLELEAKGDWTLHVLGKGAKRRAIPLPDTCLAALRAYRQARGLPAEPVTGEGGPLIHSERGASLRRSGLAAEIKAVFGAAAARTAPGDPLREVLVRASTHWLRHGYARTMVVDHRVPLPVVQELLGHASVQTTAAYARTDRSQLRGFVEESFPPA